MSLEMYVHLPRQLNEVFYLIFSTFSKAHCPLVFFCETLSSVQEKPMINLMYIRMCSKEGHASPIIGNSSAYSKLCKKQIILQGRLISCLDVISQKLNFI